jgi:protein-disulfide isomerase
MSRKRWLDAGLGVLVLCALVVTGLLVRRELSSPEAGSGGPEAREVRQVSDWRRYAEGGRWLGPPDAPVVVTEFADFQCEHCRTAARHLERLRSEFPDEVALVFRHYPLDDVHPHATEAARASECAARQGRFEAFHDLAFSLQDSIGEIRWTRLAARAGVPDTTALGECLSGDRTADVVSEDVAAGSDLGIRGTPTLLVNDQLLMGAPTYAQLEDHVERRLSE